MCQTLLWLGQGILHEQVYVSFDKRKLCAFRCNMKLNWCIHLEQWHFNSFVWYFLLPNDYDVEMWYCSEFLYNSKFTLTSKKAWNKHCRYKEGWLYVFFVSAELLPDLNRRAGFPPDTPLILYEVRIHSLKWASSCNVLLITYVKAFFKRTCIAIVKPV